MRSQTTRYLVNALFSCFIVGGIVSTCLAQGLEYEMAMKDARLALQARQVTQAINALKEAIKADPEQAEAHSTLGHIYLQQERYLEAEPHLQKAAELRSDLPELQHNLGVVLARLKKYNESVAAFAAAFKLKPDSADQARALCLAQIEAKLFAEALETAERWLQIVPGNVEALRQKVVGLVGTQTQR